MAQRQWHRLFGVAWADFFTGLPVEVQMEVDLSIRQQFLDVVLIRKGTEPLPVELPDGFQDLGEYNLLSFKSYQKPLTTFSVDELIGHYVNFREQTSPNMDEPLPAERFRLFAVTVRSPELLARHPQARRSQEGVYDLPGYSRDLRVVVIHELPLEERNARLHLFSALARGIQFGRDHCQPNSPQTSTFLNQLWSQYQGDGLVMPYTLEEFLQEATRQIARNPQTRRIVLENATPEEVLEVIPVEQVLKAVSVEQRLEGVPVEQRLEGVSVEQRLEGVPVEQRLEGVTPEELVQILSTEQRAALQRLLNESAEPESREST